ncbi:hypothetical protein RHGRI_021111 [Rhododendron griersonianum]|uniref:Uncharacterized protein n=1 Tax=Rhododendron griersonianum TaxID=479676 RepID=A0AAV6JMB4_9ERIC|nr:hypothetical protein RHGRI_021111 [Rhododendron griersonianum]
MDFKPEDDDLMDEDEDGAGGGSSDPASSATPTPPRSDGRGRARRRRWFLRSGVLRHSNATSPQLRQRSPRILHPRPLHHVTDRRRRV